MPIVAKYVVRAPNGQQTGPLYTDLQRAIDDAAAMNVGQDPSFQYVVVSVIHPTA